MKRTLLSLASMFLLTAASMAQGTITMTTAAEPGTKIRILPNAVSATSPVSIDFGDGNVQRYTVDPNLSAWQRWIEGEVKGKTIIVSGNLTEFELSDAQLTSVAVKDMTTLSTLDLSDNEINSFELVTPTPLTELVLNNNNINNSPTVNATLTLENCAESLKVLKLSENPGLQCLDARYLTALEDITISKCPDFASIFFCAPGDSRPNLKYISIADCSLSHFYPINLPALRTLDLTNNILMSENDDDPFALGNYPNLRYLTLTGNKGIKSVDVSTCPYMEQLYVNNCSLKSIDVSACPELNSLNIANNDISSIDLSGNRQLSVVLINGNPIKEIDMKQIPNVSTFNISDTKISRIDLMSTSFLKSFRASNTLLEFVDFNGQQADRMTLIDLSNNPNFTPESMNYTLHTLPVARQAWSTNLFLQGSNAEHADTEYATSQEMQWICDVEGDGTAKNTPLSITYLNSTKTGERKTGELERLYPIFAMGLSYDLEIMHTTGGDYVVAQWEPEYFQSIKDATDGTILKGVPVCVYTYPEAGKRFRSVTVNGKEIFSPWFIASENAEVKVNFTAELQSITMSVAPGQEMSFRVNTTENNGTVWIDWGTGGRIEYPGQHGYTTSGTELIGSRIDGKASGKTVTIYGDLAGLDINGFGSVAEDFGLWDNHVTALDVTNCPDLKILTAYWNPIETIDLSNNPALEILDLSYTAITDLDLSGCPHLLSLEAYSAGEEEDGIRNLKSIDLSKLPYLQNLNIKNNRLTSLDLSANALLRWVDICGNSFESIDLSHNPAIEELNLNNNRLKSIDLSANTALVDLSLDVNELTSIDLSHNPALQVVMLGNNHLTEIDLSKQTNLRNIYINGNGMNAEQLNDFFYNLPVRTYVDDPNNAPSVRWNLCLYQGLDRRENDYTGCDTSIAVDRQWTPSHSAANNGCNVAYLDCLPAVHGTYKVVDALGNTYVTGSKVEKWLPLTIEATPDADYRLYSIQLNDDPAMLGASSFDMPGIYTKLRVNFVKGAGIDGVNAATPTIATIPGAITVSGEAGLDVAVFNTAGAPVAATQTGADGKVSIPVAAGFYIVKVANKATSVAVR